MKVRVADYIINRLQKEGVTNIFQVTGRGALFLNDAVAKSTEVHGRSMHHEQACAYAAIASAEQSNNIGVAWSQQLRSNQYYNWCFVRVARRNTTCSDIWTKLSQRNKTVYRYGC